MDRTVLQGAFAVSMLGSEYPSRRGLPSKPAPLPIPLLDHWIPEVERYRRQEFTPLASAREEPLTPPELAAKPGGLFSWFQHRLKRIGATLQHWGMSIPYPRMAQGLGLGCQ